MERNMKVWLNCIGIILWGNIFSLPAQGVRVDTITQKVHSIDEVMVSARKPLSNMTATSPIQIMNKEQMERMGVQEVAEAIKHFSGVSVKDYGGIGGLKTVSVRSLGAQHTGVSYDGIAVSDCQSGQIDISRFSLDNVSLLYLTIGQSDDIYQAAKMFASAGTLNIETLSPAFLQKSYQVTANMKAGSFGLVNPSLLYAQRLNKKISISTFADFMRADGNYPFKLWNGNTLIDEKRNNSDITSWRAELNTYLSLTARQDLNLKFYLFDSERGLPGGVVYDNIYAAERLYDRNYFAQVAYENRFSDQWKLKIGSKFNYTWNRDYNNESSGITDDRFRQTETYLTATLWGNPIRNLSVSLAQDFAYNDLSTTLKNCQFPERFTYLTALAARYSHSKISVTASLLNTYATERVEVGEASDGFKRLSPALGVSWKPWDENLRFRFSYKDIFRVPTFNDLYYLSIGNVNLRPETTKQWNIGATWNRSISSLIEYFSLSVDGYYGNIKDKIVAVPTMFIWKMMNVGKVETLGIDINMVTELKWSEGWKTDFTTSYNYMQAQDVTDPASKVWKNQIAYTPKHSGAGSCTMITPWVNVTYNVIYSSKRYTSSYNSADNLMDAYVDHGLSISRKLSFGEHTLRVQLDALNLSNKNYEIVRFYPMPGRNYKLTVNYQF